MITFAPVSSQGAVGSPGKTETIEKEAGSRLSRRKAERRARRNKRLQNRLDKWKKKLERKKEKRKEKAAPNVWDDSRFRLGAILLVAGLGLALVGALLSFSFFGFLAGGLALAGVVLMIWSLVEYYD